MFLFSTERNSTRVLLLLDSTPQGNRLLDNPSRSTCVRDYNAAIALDVRPLFLYGTRSPTTGAKRRGRCSPPHRRIDSRRSSAAEEPTARLRSSQARGPVTTTAPCNRPTTKTSGCVLVAGSQFLAVGLENVLVLNGEPPSPVCIAFGAATPG
jgi:hypothetical protein